MAATLTVRGRSAGGFGDGSTPRVRSNTKTPTTRTTASSTPTRRGIVNSFNPPTTRFDGRDWRKFKRDGSTRDDLRSWNFQLSDDALYCSPISSQLRGTEIGRASCRE